MHCPPRAPRGSLAKQAKAPAKHSSKLKGKRVGAHPPPRGANVVYQRMLNAAATERIIRRRIASLEARVVMHHISGTQSNAAVKQNRMDVLELKEARRKLAAAANVAERAKRDLLSGGIGTGVVPVDRLWRGYNPERLRKLAQRGRRQGKVLR